MSSLGRLAEHLLPPTMHFLADAGYTLTSYLLIPYVIFDGMPQCEKLYNHMHSRTRIVVERAFGGLKGRWRILKRTFNMKAPGSCARTIVACMVLHNMTINAKDDVDLDDRIDPYLHSNVPQATTLDQNDINRFAKRNNIKKYLMLC